MGHFARYTDITHKSFMKFKNIIIRFVDGYRIRQFFDTDFNSFHFNQGDSLNFDSKRYIPLGEAWCDVALKDEVEFLKKVELSTVSSRAEAVKKFTQKGIIPDFKIHKKKQGKNTIVLVNGSIVRRYLDPWFVCGGHAYVYAYIPQNEIWIDAKMDVRDIPHVIVHEALEQHLMRQKKKTYDSAHEYATAAERESRRVAGGSYPGEDAFPFVSLKKMIQSFYVRGSKKR